MPQAMLPSNSSQSFLEPIPFQYCLKRHPLFRVCLPCRDSCWHFHPTRKAWAQENLNGSWVARALGVGDELTHPNFLLAFQVSTKLEKSSQKFFLRLRGALALPNFLPHFFSLFVLQACPCWSKPLPKSFSLPLCQTVQKLANIFGAPFLEEFHFVLQGHVLFVASLQILWVSCSWLLEDWFHHTCTCGFHSLHGFRCH